MNSYEAFLATKRITAAPVGLPPAERVIHPGLFDFQAAVVRWALRRGRAAIFADTGMGKTRMQLEWARHIQAHAGGKVLIVAPLMVGAQTAREAAVIDMPVSQVICEGIEPGIYITNYERLDNFNLSNHSALALDESSILKGIASKTRAKLLKAAQGIPYRLSCTATPSPNDFMEFGGQCEFLGIMPHREMLANFFIHDSQNIREWRLKKHAANGFWQWISTWAAYFKRPSDLGFSDEGFDLPPLTFEEHTVEGGETLEGFLFPVQAETLSERLQARRETVDVRVTKAAELANSDSEQWIVWCNLNIESDTLAKQIRGAVNVSGADSITEKEQKLRGFLSGQYRVLVTKPKVAGFGLNMQNCNRMIFVGLNDSYEQLYQAVRRCWRYGQKRPVQVHFVAATVEGAVVANIHRKEAQAMQLQTEMAAHMKDLTRRELEGDAEHVTETASGAIESGENWTLHNDDCVNVVRGLADNSIGYSVFSPPFISLYVYSDTPRDMGNSKSKADFYAHFAFLLTDLYRVMLPGRLVSMHCANIPLSRQMHGESGLEDFRGDLIRVVQEAGFIYATEHVIWKDPVNQMYRTKKHSLLYKTLKADSINSWPGIPDFLVTFRKRGENTQPVSHRPEDFPLSQWQKWASPVWMDIRQTNVLNRAGAREQEDEKHIAPLQLDVIERCLTLWSNPGDLVLSPFAGIGSEGYMAIRMGRRFIGAELKPSYFRIACDNLRKAKTMQTDLFASMDSPMDDSAEQNAQESIEADDNE